MLHSNPNNKKKKAQIRTSFKKKRLRASTSELYEASRSLCDNLIIYHKQKDFSAQQKIAGYYPAGNEISPVNYLQDIAIQNIILLPRIICPENNQMHFVKWNGNKEDLVKGEYNIFTVRDSETATPDIIIMPLIAFDRKGTRLGTGGGFYDRFISKLKREGHRPHLIGAAYQWQKFNEDLPYEKHDINMHTIITDKEIIEVNQQ